MGLEQAGTEAACGRGQFWEQSAQNVTLHSMTEEESLTLLTYLWNKVQSQSPRPSSLEHHLRALAGR